MKTADIAIIGGGVIGAACARAAALRGLRVTLFEPGPDPAAASPASAGMLAAQVESPDGNGSLSLRARDGYTALAAALLETTNIDVGLWLGGIASLAFTETAELRLKQAVATQRQAGLRCDWLDPSE